MPAVNPVVRDIPPPDEDDHDEEEKGRRRTGRGDDDGSGRHQLITGLIKTLPSEGSEWSLEERHRWLQLAAGIFDFVYKTKDAHGNQRVLSIELKSAK